MGLWLYIEPQLTGRRLYSETLGNICMVLWNIALAVGVVGLATARTQSREYVEFIWIVDIVVMVVLLINMFNIYMAISNRMERRFEFWRYACCFHWLHRSWNSINHCNGK